MDKTDIQAYLEAGKLLYAMVNQNLLVSTNKGRWTTYSINKDFVPLKVENSRSRWNGME
jgi:ATP-dependent DNA helicase RecG